MGDPLRFWVTSVAIGVVLFVVLLIAVFATGSTFGQQCAHLYEYGSTDWRLCVARLAHAPDKSP